MKNDTDEITLNQDLTANMKILSAYNGNLTANFALLSAETDSLTANLHRRRPYASDSTFSSLTIEYISAASSLRVVSCRRSTLTVTSFCPKRI